MSWLERIHSLCAEILITFSHTSQSILDFLNKEFFDAPLYYWLFGGGLFIFLTYKIVKRLVLV